MTFTSPPPEPTNNTDRQTEVDALYAELLNRATQQEREWAFERAQLLAQALAPGLRTTPPQPEPRRNAIARLAQMVARGGGL